MKKLFFFFDKIMFALSVKFLGDFIAKFGG